MSAHARSDSRPRSPHDGGAVVKSDPGLHDLRWYHSIDLPDGSTTPGEYDLRAIVAKLPLPASMEGMRCLDVGSRDGFYAFEMERRGAAEVISLDIEDPDDVHFPGVTRPDRALIEKELADGHAAFDAAATALGSCVQRELRSVYDLPELGLLRFDFAVIGTLLLHLRDPLRALDGVRAVLGGRLLLNEPVTPGFLSVVPVPSAELLMQEGPFWRLCNPAGQRRLVEAAGFRILDSSRPYIIPAGRGGRRILGLAETVKAGSLRSLPTRLVQRRGILHAWILASTAGYSSAR